MAQSLFHRPSETTTAVAAPVTPHQKIEKEVAHLKKGTTARYGNKPRQKASVWALSLVLCTLVGLYVMDPIEHAWYRYGAIRDYMYLHNGGTGKEADELAASGILRTEEITQLNQSLQNYKDYYATPEDAARTARTIINYMASVKALHAGRWEQLNFINRVRFDLFVRWGIQPPVAWDCIDIGVVD